jgi:hypothetical protein
LVFVLFFLLSFFFWLLYCLSFYPFSFGYCIVCPFGYCIVCPFVLFLLVIVMFVLLSFFFWLLYCLSFCPFFFVIVLFVFFVQ